MADEQPGECRAALAVVMKFVDDISREVVWTYFWVLVLVAATVFFAFWAAFQSRRLVELEQRIEQLEQRSRP